MSQLWSESDLLEVAQAIKQLALGNRVVKVAFSGLNGALHTTEYAQADLPQLQRLRREIEGELARGAGHSAVSVIASNKGLSDV